MVGQRHQHADNQHVITTSPEHEAVSVAQAAYRLAEST